LQRFPGLRWFELFQPGFAGGFVEFGDPAAGFGSSCLRSLPSAELRLVQFDGGHLLELLHRGQLGDVLQAEAQQELARGFVENGPADDRLAAGGGDQLAGQQRTEDAGRIHAANLVDFGRGDRLLVGDDGQGFQRRQRELERRLQALDKEPHRVVALGLGGHAVAAGDLANLDAAIVGGVGGDQFVEQLAENGADLAVALAGLALGGSASSSANRAESWASVTGSSAA
jgi:hypothetical protein